MSGLATYFEALRPHQWAKNLLVFLPLLAAHEATNATLLLQAGLAFWAMSLCASSNYVINDLLDVEADRAHPRKRARPFASGRIPTRLGPLVAIVPFVAGVSIALLLPRSFLLLLGLYLVISLSYSLYLKSVLLVDVVVLAGLYTIRIIAGGAAVSITPSFWLLAFSMFLFLSLAMVKRYSELLELGEVDGSYIPGRGYLKVDLDTINALGISGGYMAVLVLALYLNSEEVTATYSHPEAIWLVCPLLLYWISRVWIVAGRGRMHEDPLVFALKDRVTLLAAVVSFAILMVAA